MSKSDKLKARILSSPKDFSWSELVNLMGQLGYEEVSGGKTGGSRKRFIHANYEAICLHKPHPRKILKSYQIRQIVEALKERKQL